MRPIVVAMTGASGALYAVRLIDVLLSAEKSVHLTISPSAVIVLETELGIRLDLNQFDVSLLEPIFRERSEPPHRDNPQKSATPDPTSTASRGTLTYHHYQDFSAGIASGSFQTAGMVICPCSMGTLGSLAGGLSSNLIHRAADVHLKERRKLVVVPRETPLGSIALQNMKTLSDAGAVILPAMPGFYHHPETIHDLIDFVVSRICDQLVVDVNLTQLWGNSPHDSN